MTLRPHRNASGIAFLPIGFGLLLALLLAGCTTETGPIPVVGGKDNPENAENDSTLKNIVVDGPVSFEVLRRVMAPPSMAVASCAFRNGNPGPNSTNPDGLSRVALRIASQAELDAVISCHDSLVIDFGNAFVLAGRSAPQPNQIRIDTLRLDLKNDTLRFGVGLRQGYATAPSSADYIIKVSTDYVAHPVIFDVHWVGERIW